jgi:hypothetical protein
MKPAAEEGVLLLQGIANRTLQSSHMHSLADSSQESTPGTRRNLAAQWHNISSAAPMHHVGSAILLLLQCCLIFCAVAFEAGTSPGLLGS